jgi:3-oxoacyl-[acyl-carrier protein] reductase
MSTVITQAMGRAAQGVLTGKVAIVTGAGRGIGRAIAIGYAQAGAAVCCMSRSSDEINETAALIGAAGGQAIAVAADVRDLAAVEGAVARTVESFGGLDILVANHGVQTVEASGPMETTDPAAWRETVEINLIGAYHCMRSVIEPMKARGAGKIIAVGSGQGHRGSTGNSAYASSKAGLWMMVQVLAQELAPFNISVNELLPGHVATRIYKEMTAKLKGTGHADLQKPKDLRPSEWCKEPEDVVPLALFLACQPDLGPSAQSYSLMRRF